MALVAALILGFALFWWNSVTPTALPATASPLDFSAERAMSDIRAMAPVPRPIGSPAAATVRDFLLMRLRGMGLAADVQRGSSFQVRGTDLSGGTTENVIGVLAGSDPAAPALVLMAHRDSVAGSPGAADDAAGVASALEMVRAIKEKGTPLRDVVVLITDGEEVGLLGARVFFDESPLSAHVGYVINMEARGGGGRAAMFETAADNGADIDLYRRTARQPDSNALTVFVYKLMPNDTDFTVVRQHGKAGLNYAFIGRQFDYHSPSSTPDALDAGSVQHMGAEILPTAMALAFGPLPAREPDVVYGNVLAGWIPAYPPAFGWAILLAAAGLIGVGAVRARRSNVLFAADLARGCGAAFYVTALAATLLELSRRATGVGSGWIAYRPILARFTTFEAMMAAAALGAVFATVALAHRPRSRWIAVALPLVAGVAACLFGGLDSIALVAGLVGAVVGALAFGTPMRSAGWTGLLLVALAASLALQIAAPLVAYVVAWPLLAAGLASAATAAGAERGPRALVVMAAIATLGLAWLLALFHALLQGLDVPLLAVVPTWLASLLIWPLAQRIVPGRPLAPASTLVVVALVVASYLHLTTPWTPRHPNAVEPVYIVDPAARLAWRASLLAPDDWTRDVLLAEGGTLGQSTFDFIQSPVTAAAAAPVDGRPVPATLARQPDGSATLSFGVPPGAASVVVTLQSSGAIDRLTVDGKPAHQDAKGGGAPYRLPAGQPGRITWYGSGRATFSFHTEPGATLRASTAAVYDAWSSAQPLPALPPDDQPWDRFGSSMVLGTASERRTQDTP